MTPQLVRTVAARAGHDLGKDLTESFYQQWVTGQCMPYLRCVASWGAIPPR